MSAKEAAAKADALIAQYRAKPPRTKRASPRIGTMPAFGVRAKLVLMFVCVFVAGLNWRAHPVWSAVLALCGIALAFGIVGLQRAEAEPSPDVVDR